METNTNPTSKIISIINIDFRESFDQLTEEEKNYLYYLSKACWAGQLIDLFQTSYESPALFMIFQKFFGSFPDVYELEEIMKKNDIDPDIFDKFMEYAARFYSNFGNYTIKKKNFFLNFLFLQTVLGIMKQICLKKYYHNQINLVNLNQFGI